MTLRIVVWVQAYRKQEVKEPRHRHGQEALYHGSPDSTAVGAMGMVRYLDQATAILVTILCITPPTTFIQHQCTLSSTHKHRLCTRITLNAEPVGSLGPSAATAIWRSVIHNSVILPPSYTRLVLQSEPGRRHRIDLSCQTMTQAERADQSIQPLKFRVASESVSRQFNSGDERGSRAMLDTV